MTIFYVVQTESTGIPRQKVEAKTAKMAASEIIAPGSPETRVSVWTPEDYRAGKAPQVFLVKR